MKSARPRAPGEDARRKPIVMQRVLARMAMLLLVLLLTIALAGCGGSGELAREARLAV